MSSTSGAQVHGLAWSPVDPSSVALAVSPNSLIMITLKDVKVEMKTENIPARSAVKVFPNVFCCYLIVLNKHSHDY